MRKIVFVLLWLQLDSVLVGDARHELARHILRRWHVAEGLPLARGHLSTAEVRL